MFALYQLNLKHLNASAIQDSIKKEIYFLFTCVLYSCTCTLINSEVRLLEVTVSDLSCIAEFKTILKVVGCVVLPNFTLCLTICIFICSFVLSNTSLQ